jgi:hypothetical protein
VPSIALTSLEVPLVVNVLMPLLHNIVILVTDDEIVNDARIALPEDLDSVRA